MAIDKREVLRRVEGDYLLDYAVFTGAMREYVTSSLEERFGKDKNDLHRRMFLLAVFREEYSAYEDLGAMLAGLLAHRQDETVPLLEGLISYRPGQVELAKVMQQFEIDTSDQLYEKLGLGDLIPAEWRQEFPDLDLEKALRTAAHFFFRDCARNQKKDGLRAFNKMKHGLLVVPNAARYLPNLVDAPAALFKTDDTRPDAAVGPFSVYAVPMTDEHLEGRLRSINFIQANLRMIAVLRVIARHPDVIKRRGVMNTLEVLRTPHLSDLLSFMEQVTNSGNGDATHSKFNALQQLLSRMRRWVGWARARSVHRSAGPRLTSAFEPSGMIVGATSDQPRAGGSCAGR